MELEEMRIKAAWIGATIGWPIDLKAVDRCFTVDNRVADYDLPFTKQFKFQGLVGIIDGYNYVQWGGMGMHLIDICGADILAAIHEQTGR